MNRRADRLLEAARLAFGLLLSATLFAHAEPAVRPSAPSAAQAGPTAAVAAPAPAPQPTQAVEEVAAPEPPPPPTPLERFHQLVNEGKTDDAIAVVHAALQDDGENVDLLLALGEGLRRKRDHRAAVKLYEQVLKLRPDLREAVYAQCLLHVQMSRDAKDPATAAALMSAAAKLLGGELTAAIASEHVARVVETGNAEAAYAAHAAIPPGSDDIEPRLTLSVARLCRDARLVEKAQELYRGLLARLPGDPDAAIGLAIVYEDIGDHGNALAAIGEGLAVHPDHTGMLYARAAVELKKRDLCAAARTYDRILAVRPDDSDAANQKASILLDLGGLGLAQEFADCHKAAIDPKLYERIRAAHEAQHALWARVAPADESVDPPLAILTYHDVPATPTDAPFSVARRDFIDQLEYLKGRNYQFVGCDALLAARNDVQPLPSKAVVLTFDGGYASFHSNVTPVLQLYGYPAMVAICTSWMEEKAPEGARPPLMDWAQVRSTASNSLFSVASLTHSLDGWLPRNPQGDVGAAAVTRAWLSSLRRYETDDEFRERIARDLKRSLDAFEANAAMTPQAVAWPFGACNAPSLAEASELGFTLSFAQATAPRSTGRFFPSGRWSVPRTADLAEFIQAFHVQGLTDEDDTDVRGMDVNLDLVADKTAVATERNFQALLNRVSAIGANTVYVHAGADPDRDGNVEALYFPSRLLPMKADLLSHVTEGLHTLGVSVHVVMPVLGFGLEDRELTDRLGVLEISAAGTHHRSALWVRRLSPFHPRSAEIVKSLYEDLAAHVAFDGVVFGADALLTDREDFNAAAIERYREVFGMHEFSLDALDENRRREWTRLKTRQLTELTASLADLVRGYQPGAQVSRCLFAPALHYPPSETWLAQNFADALRDSNRVIVLANPEAEGVMAAGGWLETLVRTAGSQEGGLAKTVFSVPAYDTQRSRWVRERDLSRRLRTLAQAGARHLLYQGDDFQIDRPRAESIRHALAIPSASARPSPALAGAR